MSAIIRHASEAAKTRVEPKQARLSLRQLCELLRINRTKPVLPAEGREGGEPSADGVDRRAAHTRHPFFGSRRLTAGGAVDEGEGIEPFAPSLGLLLMSGSD